MIWLALALALWAVAAAYAVHCWSLVEIARANMQATISNNVRASAQQIERSLLNLRATFSGPASVEGVTPPTRPHFGQKPHVAVDNDKPGGDAA